MDGELDRRQRIAVASICIDNTNRFNDHKTCTIDDITMESYPDLIQMAAFSALLQFIQKHCSTKNVGHLRIALPNKTNSLTKFSGAGGFQLCNCWRPYELDESVYLCKNIPSVSKMRDYQDSRQSLQTVSERKIKSEPSDDRSDGSRQSASVSDHGSVRPSKTDERFGYTYSINMSDRPSRQAYAAQSWRKDAGLDLQRQRSARDRADDPMQSGGDSLKCQSRTPLYQAQNLSSQVRRGKKEYCMHWITTGECNYMQQGCRYKHELPADKETWARIGLRKMPEWLLESPDSSAQHTVKSSAPQYLKSTDQAGAVETAQKPWTPGIMQQPSLDIEATSCSIASDLVDNNIKRTRIGSSSGNYTNQAVSVKRKRPDQKDLDWDRVPSGPSKANTTGHPRKRRHRSKK